MCSTTALRTSTKDVVDVHFAFFINNALQNVPKNIFLLFDQISDFGLPSFSSIFG
jgi:hypothetical protein